MCNWFPLLNQINNWIIFYHMFPFKMPHPKGASKVAPSQWVSDWNCTYFFFNQFRKKYIMMLWWRISIPPILRGWDYVWGQGIVIANIIQQSSPFNLQIIMKVRASKLNNPSLTFWQFWRSIFFLPKLVFEILWQIVYYCEVLSKSHEKVHLVFLRTTLFELTKTNWREAK